MNKNTWLLDYDRTHAFTIYSDLDAWDEDNLSIIIPPEPEETLHITKYSDLFDQEFYRTKITKDGDSEVVELNLDERLISVVLDQSGSMTWNDNASLRHDIIKEMINILSATYPGNIKYNLVTFGGTPIQIFFYGVVVDYNINDTDIVSLNSHIFGDADNNFAGVRVVRKEGSYPNDPLDGDIVTEGLMTKALDENLVSGTRYFYTLFTYNSNYSAFSNGVRINAVPITRDIPRGISLINYNTYKGTGVSRDDNVVGLWHFDEQDGAIVYDFSDSKTDLLLNGDEIWYQNNRVASGISGLRFDGVDSYLYSNEMNVEQTLLNEITIMAFIFPYDAYSTDPSVEVSYPIVARQNATGINYFFYMLGDSLGFSNGITNVVSEEGVLTENEWNHIAVTCNFSTGLTKFYVNGINVGEEVLSTPGTAAGLMELMHMDIGYDRYFITTTQQYFWGRICELSIHNIVRTESYILSYSNSNLDEDYKIIKSEDELDNGDRLVVLKYAVPEDFNFSNGFVKIVRSEKNIPSWDGDQDSSVLLLRNHNSSGFFYTTDTDDFALGETYYYRVFSENVLGNVSYPSDSPVIEVQIPYISQFDYLPLLSFTSTPSNLITRSGNKKVYLQWDNGLQDNVSRIKVYHSYSSFPVVGSNGQASGTLIYTGLSGENEYVHRYVENDKRSYYTVYYLDKYRRPSQTDDILSISGSTMPTRDSNEIGIPLMEVQNVYYELVNNDSISISWEHPIGFQKDISGYLDQKVLFYAAVTDQYGRLIEDQVSITMEVVSTITRQDQAEDVFINRNVSDINDSDLYQFSVSQDETSGFLKGILTMTMDSYFLGVISEASFSIRVNCRVSGRGGSEDLFSFKSDFITATLENPWDIELINRDNLTVSEKCYVIEPGQSSSAYGGLLSVAERPDRLIRSLQTFNGIYIRSENPFAARAILTYRGESLSREISVDVAVWEAEMDLCSYASSDDVQYSGNRVRPSPLVSPPSSTIRANNQTIEVFDEDGNVIQQKKVSIVDIPLYAPDSTHAVQLYVKGSQGGFTSVKNMYILFQSILNLDITVDSPLPDGFSVAEQFANAWIVDPDDPTDANKATVPSDGTIVSWNILKRDRAIDRPFYSLEEVSPETHIDGVFSIIRSGTARNVFFGPATDVDYPFEQYEINATITYDGLTRKARGFVQLYGSEENSPLAFGQRFLMELSETDSGKYPRLNPQRMWADGIDYSRLIISRDSNSSTTRWSVCFRTCASQAGRDLIELSSNQLIELRADNPNVEFIWGDITEYQDPYTDRWTLFLGSGSYTSKGQATIELNHEDISDTTPFYVRINQNVGKRPSSLVECDKSQEINPCDCLNLTDCDKALNGDITISGSTSVYIENNPFTVIGGGSMTGGVPPTMLSPYEPLKVRLISRKVNGIEYTNKGNETFYNMTLEESSIINITVEVSFRDENIPDGTSVFAVMGNNDGTSKLIAQNNRVLTYTDLVSMKSYADIVILPTRIPKDTFIENVKILCTYDELDIVERNEFIELYITIKGTDDQVPPPVEDPFVPEETVPENNIFSGTVERYNIEDNVWSVIYGMKESRGNAVVEFVNGRLYVIGGLNQNTISRTNEEYSLATDEWVTKTSMPTSRFGASSVIIGNIIYVIGGIKEDEYSGERIVSTDVESYDTITDEWTILTSMPLMDNTLNEDYGVAFGVAEHFEVAGQDYIFILSGIRRINRNEQIVEYNDRILYYYVNSNSWTYTLDKLVGLSSELYECLAPVSIVEGTEIIVFGGSRQNSDDSYSLMEESYVYNIFASTVSRADNRFWGLPHQRVFSSLVLDSDSGDNYVLGGSDNNSEQLKKMEKIVLTEGRFTVTNLLDMPVAKTGISCATGTIDDEDPYIYSSSSPIYQYLNKPHIFVVGGYTSGNETGFVNIDLGFEL